MGGLGPHRVSHCRSPALRCIFIPQSEKRASRWGGAGGGRVELVCAVCVSAHGGEGGRLYSGVISLCPDSFEPS